MWNTVNITIYSILWKYNQWCSVSFHSKWFMLGDFNSFVLPSDMRSIKMSQLQMCTYHLLHFTLSFGEGEDGGGGYWIRCTHRGCDEFIIFGTHKEDISFIHCLIFSLSRSLDKLLLTQVVLDQALSEPFKCYLVLVNSKKKPVWPTKKTTAYILFLYSKYLLPTRLKQEKVKEPTIIRE